MQVVLSTQQTPEVINRHSLLFQITVTCDVEALFTSAFKIRLTCNKTFIPVYAVHCVHSFNQSNPATSQYTV